MSNKPQIKIKGKIQDLAKKEKNISDGSFPVSVYIFPDYYIVPIHFFVLLLLKKKNNLFLVSKVVRSFSLVNIFFFFFVLFFYRVWRFILSRWYVDTGIQIELLIRLYKLSIKIGWNPSVFSLAKIKYTYQTGLGQYLVHITIYNPHFDVFTFN